MSMTAARYDENQLVEMLADGAPYDKVAAAVGITVSMVGKIARGDSRRKLWQRIEDIRQARQQAVHEIAVARAADLMRAHVNEGLTGSGETARKCREFVLELLLPKDDCPTDLLETLLAESAKPAVAEKSLAGEAQAQGEAVAGESKDQKDDKDCKAESTPIAACASPADTAGPATVQASPAPAPTHSAAVQPVAQPAPAQAAPPALRRRTIRLPAGAKKPKPAAPAARPGPWREPESGYSTKSDEPAAGN
ncbi:MAG: hypothetical protein LLG01_02135 [Planctomycetaceae bacterium]|nr:hypothetical protein [Planctomycetaceae bacterium]